jgi:adenine deaminase
LSAAFARFREARWSAKNGEILAELQLPMFGTLSDLLIETIARRLQQIKSAVPELGVPFPDPLLSLITLTGAAIPYLIIYAEGLVNLKDGKTAEFVVT